MVGVTGRGRNDNEDIGNGLTNGLGEVLEERGKGSEGMQTDAYNVHPDVPLT